MSCRGGHGLGRSLENPRAGDVPAGRPVELIRQAPCRVLAMEYAGVALRFVAVLIDGIVLIPVLLVLALVFGSTYSTSENGGHTVGVTAGGWWPFLVIFAYYVASEALTGQTLGKRALGLRVVDASGEPIELGQAVVRNLLRIVDAILFYLVAAISVWTSSERQRIGDRVANTIVVHDRGDLPERVRLTPPSVGGPDRPRSYDSTVYYTQDRFLDDLARAKERSSGVEGPTSG
jgi:uncharacterized RDD family membrane protein YckC